MKIKIKTQSPATRCEICHKSDSFNPQTNQCSRCSAVADAQIQQSAGSTQRHAIGQHSIPAFLGRNRSARDPKSVGMIVVAFAYAVIFIVMRMSSSTHMHRPIESLKPTLNANQPVHTVQSIPAPVTRSTAYQPLFLEAAKRGDIDEVNRLIKLAHMSGISENVMMAYLNATDDNGMTALMWASQNGHSDIVKSLIKAGADLEATNGASGTALMCAAQQGHTEIALALIEAGADTEATGSFGTGATALMWASMEGHTDTVKAMIAAGANPNARDNAGASALTYAIRQGRRETARVLTEAGAKRQ